MPSPKGLSRHLQQCWADGAEPSFALADAKLWFLALSRLIETNRLDAAAHAAPRLQAAFPAVASFRRTALLLDKMPEPVADPAFTSFVDRPEREVQVVRRMGASTALFAFTGRFGALGLPTPIIHRWFARTQAHLVYLRDPLQRAFLSGVPTLGDDVETTLAALRGMANDLGAQRLACYGNSSGGYAALLYGLKLPAARVLGIGAWTDLSVQGPERINDSGWTAATDLRPLYESAAVRPRVRLVYGADNVDDRANADHLADLEGVHTRAVSAWRRHDPQLGLIAEDSFGSLLTELVTPAEPRSD